MNKKVSIIMAAYNAEAFIAEAIESVLGQTYGNFELIIVDDGSTDQTAARIKTYSDPRIQYLYQENKGQCAATNQGLRHVSGDLVMFLDADDKIDDEKLAHQVRQHEDDRDISISTFAVFPGPDHKSKNPLFASMEAIDWIKTMLKSGSYVANNCYLIPASLIRAAGGYNERLTLNNDFEYFNRVVSHSRRMIYCPDALSFYRKEGQASLSLQADFSSYQNQWLARTLSYDFLLSKWSSEELKSLIAHDLYRLIYTTFYRNKEVTNLALDYIEKLGAEGEPPIVNDSMFGRFQRLVGFQGALKIKKMVTHLRGK